MSRSFSPRDLADALGVSESSLKRWIDAGRIRATRTGGGHRRIALADALDFVRATGAPLVRPDLLGLGAAADQDNRAPTHGAPDLFRALLDGDGPAVRTWLAARLAAGEPLAALCDGPLRAAMHALGELWRHEDDGVFIEHRATDVCLQALSHLRASFEPPPNAPIALGGAPEDDPYLLPSAMAALVLASIGYRTINLGADTPTAALHRAVAHHHPRLVWLSASTPLVPAQADELAAFLASLPPTTTALAGGRHAAALSAADPTVRVAESMSDLAALGRELL